MGKVLIIGAGGVGTVVAHKIAQNPDVFTEIVLASRTQSKCDAIADAIGGNRIVTDRVDADKVEDLVALFKKHKPDIVVNVALPYQDLTIMDACLHCGAKGKIKQASNTYKTLREPLDLEIPLAVLVNGGTASSSEILAGSLQDLDRAVIIGNRTFGKGLVQTTRPLPYGGTMKLTTSKYYIPSGRCVQAIDYKHRNEDGSVGRIPDSLTTVFHTAAGREVRDGGGVTPDIAVKQEKLPNILFYLVNDNLIFNYATDYCLKHPTISSAEQFEITDADYADFKAMVKKADFKYDQQTEKMLKNLKEMAEFEGYLTDASKEFEALEKKLSHNLDRDLDHFSKDIKSMIAVEIIKRYYFQRGSIIQQLKDDDDLKEAVKILTAPEKYKEMLTAPAVTSMSLQQRKETAPVFLSTATRANEHVYDEIV